MKKIVMILGSVFIITMCVYSTKCQDVIVRVNQLNNYGEEVLVNNILEENVDESQTIQNNEAVVPEQAANVAEQAVNSTEKVENVAEQAVNVPKKVRIILMNDNFSSIYHRNVKIDQSQKITITYGKKMEKSKKITEDFVLDAEGEYFKEGKKIKITNAQRKIKMKSILRNGNANTYPGEIYLYHTKNGIVVVNELEINDYVAAVVSSELSASYPYESLKAQAVCARTYIAKRKNNKKYKKFKAYADDSTAYQVYNIVEPNDEIQKAVTETNGEVITYQNKLINAYFFSTSCGYTTDYKIWGKAKQKYLQCVSVQNQEQTQIQPDYDVFFKTNEHKDIESEYPFYRWNVKMSGAHIRYVVSNYVGYDIGEVSKVEINQRGEGGIVANITVYGENKQVNISNQSNIRKALNPYGLKIKLNNGEKRTNMSMLPSAFFMIESTDKEGKWNGIRIYGGGFGHGAGMSQNGCKEFALAGYHYQDIIHFFYKDTSIVK